MRLVLSLCFVIGCRPPQATEPQATPPPAPDPAPPIDVRFVELPVTLHQHTPLDEVALAAARAASEDHVVSTRAVRAAMAAQLGSGMWPHVLSAWGTDAEIAAQLEAELVELRASADIAELGVATASGKAGRVGVVVALPLPRLPIEVGRGSATSRITMPWQWSEAPAAFAVTSTTSRRLAPTLDEQGFDLAIDCTRPAAIEIRAGARVVATVVDACGEAVDGDAFVTIDVGPPAHTRVELERRVFELANRERVAHGRPALAWDDDAHRFAREHALDMARFAYVGHAAPDGSSLPRRLEHAAFRSSSTRENVGHAWGPGEVHDAFMASPGHRTNLLADDIERGAIGIELDRRDPRAFYVTQFFRTP